MKINAYAKINLTLDVIGKLPNGYHSLEMIMQTVELHDIITLERRDEGIDFYCNEPALEGRDNLAVRAAEAFFGETGLKGGVIIRLYKEIPIAAGLAGGSTDAAAVLRGLNELYNSGLSFEKLCKIGLKMGADVPFCVMGGTRLCEGVGERMRELKPLPDCALLLIKPDFTVSTPEVYKKIDGVNFKHPNNLGAEDALTNGDLDALASVMENALEAVTGAEHPEIYELKKALEQEGAVRAMMSGSGPTVFGIFKDVETAKAAKARLKGRGRLILTKPYNN